MKISRDGFMVEVTEMGMGRRIEIHLDDGTTVVDTDCLSISGIERLAKLLGWIAETEHKRVVRL